MAKHVSRCLYARSIPIAYFHVVITRFCASRGFEFHVKHSGGGGMGGACLYRLSAGVEYIDNGDNDIFFKFDIV